MSLSIQELLNSNGVRAFAAFCLRIRQPFFVTLFCLSLIYLFACLLSYHPTDMAWSHSFGSNTQPVADTVHNVGGVTGAWLSDVLFLFFGVGAWASLLWLAHEAYVAHHDRAMLRAPMRILAYTLLWVALCINLHAASRMVSGADNWGGIIGLECFTAITSLIGHVGTVLLALVATALMGYLLLDIESHAAPDITDDARVPMDAHPENIQDTQPTSEKNSHTPHGHKGALESFLAHSGLRDALLSGTYDTQVTKSKHPEHTVAASVATTNISSQPTSSHFDTTDAEHTPAATDMANTTAADTLTTTTNNTTAHTKSLPIAEADNIDTQEKDIFSGINLSHLAITSAIPANTNTEEIPMTHADDKPIHATTEIATDDQATNTESKPADDAVTTDVFAFADDIPLESSTSEVPPDDAVLKGVHEEASNDSRADNLYTDQDLTTDDSTAQNTTFPHTFMRRARVTGFPADAEAVDASPVDVTKPDISDDARYARHSFAMHMGAYRTSLSPIPPLSLLDPTIHEQISYSDAQLQRLSELLEIKLKEFGINAQVMGVMQGPVVTSFEVDLAPGVKVSKVTNIAKDLARSLSMGSLRVVEIIQGKPYIGIEIPNQRKQTVKLIELLEDTSGQNTKGKIALAMGKDISGQPIIIDLAKAPHMLVAGTTGSGKSVLINAMLLSMLLQYTPDELRLILIDPKMLELANYSDIPHLLTPVVTDMTEAASALSWCVGEMERRYHLMSLLRVRSLVALNDLIAKQEALERPILDPMWRPNDSVSVTSPPKLKPLPLIVLVADEFADLIMQVGKQAEELITRLAQKSRAAGIHLILATQRPSVDVVTGLIKANIPSRAALRVNSKVDSRTILEAGGAEDMLGHGDMLFVAPGKNEPMRVHGAYVSDGEVNRICDAWRERGYPEYIEAVSTTSFDVETSTRSSNNSSLSSGLDPLYDDAVAAVIAEGKVSTSFIQRKLNIGYNRAARIIESMQEQGIVSPPDRSSKRTLLIS